jgi:D-alanine-D-alanine ligase
VNPLAGLTPGYSDLPLMAELSGMGYGELIDQILRCTLARLDAR